MCALTLTHFWYVSSLKTHLLTDNTLHHVSVQNPVLFNSVNMLNTDKLLPVGVVLYCQTVSSFPGFSGILQIDWINQYVSVLYSVLKKGTDRSWLKICFSISSSLLSCFPKTLQSFLCVEINAFRAFFYWLVFGHCERHCVLDLFSQFFFFFVVQQGSLPAAVILALCEISIVQSLPMFQTLWIIQMCRIVSNESFTGVLN